ncbi:N-acetylmuramoyl-L-alanine amidase [Streptomyces sp. NPDC057499]|uniref:peptidoglycan recognition protein family protein n=1 Tax=Streptomyces sp. NPDC057499 TaxID=3346150 RepID=UPI0036901F40
MRAFLVSSIGVACAAVLALPSAVPAGAAPAPASTSAHRTAPAGSAAPDGASVPGRPSVPDRPSVSDGASVPDRAATSADVPGATQSLPLRALPVPSDRVGDPATVPDEGLPEREVSPFSLLGVVWNDADAELRGTVQVRTRATGTGTWSSWQSLETHNAEHSADLGTAERDSAAVRGSTAPLWVGDSDAVSVRVRPEAPDPQGRTGTAEPLPRGLHLELVDPGQDPRTSASGAAKAWQSGRTGQQTGRITADGVLPALSKAASEALGEAEAGLAPGTRPYIGPRPGIVTRKGWGADEKLRERTFVYTSTVKAAFIHHSATGNNYTCAEAPAVLRGIYRYHVKSSGWRDIGYNFAVDKCGNIYEGRAGGVTKAVLGAHTLGFNSNTMGIAVLGTFTDSNPPAAAVSAIAKLTAWKLGLFGANPKGKVTLVSGGSNKYKKGVKVSLNVISGHRDGYATECPGARLYNKLGSARSSSAQLQGR